MKVLYMPSYHAFMILWVNKGAAELCRWTQNSLLNILIKKLLIPINRYCHCSWIIVINPSHVDHFDESNEEAEVPCMLHMDSLQLHDMKTISSNLQDWLNIEYVKRKLLDKSNIYNGITMECFLLSGTWHRSCIS